MIYTAKCRQCGIEQDYIASVANRKKTPSHCGKKMQRIMVAAMVAPMFQEYRAVGIPGKPWIKTKQEHKDTLRQHGKVEIGNDSSMSPPKMERGEFEHRKSEQLSEILRDRQQIDNVSRQLGLD